MAGKLHLSISTAYGESLEMEVDYVQLPSANGRMGVLPGHANMLCALKAGELVYSLGPERKTLSIGEGVATISPEQAILLVDRLDLPEELDT